MNKGCVVLGKKRGTVVQFFYVEHISKKSHCTEKKTRGGKIKTNPIII